jgi:3-hydroxyacyl-CoA dehydrogenase/enoyl-CoA hydratase/3-hydroxybutyryl-CoA epimerase
VYAEFGHGGARRDVAAEEIQRRCVLAMLNEAARCLDEGVIASPRDGDVAAVFGFGFPPFRGGPFRYIDRQGAGRIVEELEGLNERFPGRFEPAPLLLDVAARQARFYPATGRPV